MQRIKRVPKSEFFFYIYKGDLSSCFVYIRQPFKVHARNSVAVRLDGYVFEF